MSTTTVKGCEVSTLNHESWLYAVEVGIAVGWDCVDADGSTARASLRRPLGNSGRCAKRRKVVTCIGAGFGIEAKDYGPSLTACDGYIHVAVFMLLICRWDADGGGATAVAGRHHGVVLFCGYPNAAAAAAQGRGLRKMRRRRQAAEIACSASKPVPSKIPRAGVTRRAVRAWLRFRLLLQLQLLCALACREESEECCLTSESASSLLGLRYELVVLLRSTGRSGGGE